MSSSDVRPFLEVILPENNVLSIESVITLTGTNFIQEPSIADYLNPINKWYEVDALAEDKVFVDDNTKITDNAGVRAGKWISVNQKFIREYTDLGFTKMILGGGSQDITSISQFDTNSAIASQIGNFINNMSLGTVPTANTTMFIKYRVGGGADTNLGPNVLRGLGILNMDVNGSNQQINNAVKNSLKVNNAFPALGGKDSPSVEEVKNMPIHAVGRRAHYILDAQSYDGTRILNNDHLFEFTDLNPASTKC